VRSSVVSAEGKHVLTQTVQCNKLQRRRRSSCICYSWITGRHTIELNKNKYGRHYRAVIYQRT